MSERDTKFANFAQLLARELTNAGVFYETTGIGQLTIAQRAYDLVSHVLDKDGICLSTGNAYWPEFIYDTDEIMKGIPDLTEWPKT